MLNDNGEGQQVEVDIIRNGKIILHNDHDAQQQLEMDTVTFMMSYHDQSQKPSMKNSHGE